MKSRLQKIVTLLLIFSCALSLSKVCDAQETNGTDKIITDFSISTVVKGRAKIKFDPAYKIHIDNSSTGRITVIGWDKDMIEATSTSERGDEIIVVRSYTDEAQPVLYIKSTDFKDGYYTEKERTVSKESQLDIKIDKNETSEKEIDKEKPKESKENKESKKERQDSPSDSSKSPATIQPPTKPNAPDSAKPEVNSPEPQKKSTDNLSLSDNPLFFYRQNPKVNIEVKVPRKAELMPINVIRSDVEVRNIDTPVKVLGAQSTISLGNVASAEVRTKNGDVTVENAAGLVDLTTARGSIIVKNANSDVRILSISGAIDVRCARGRVNISTTEGDITLSGASSDVEASNTYGAILFTGAIQKDGRYYLKSMSGRVEMRIQSEPPGFLANLSSYRGKVETSFAFKNKETSGDNHSNSPEQRIKGTYGKGQALITLSSFDREVILTKATANELKNCGN